MVLFLSLYHLSVNYLSSIYVYFMQNKGTPKDSWKIPQLTDGSVLLILIQVSLLCNQILFSAVAIAKKKKKSEKIGNCPSNG